MKKYALCPPIRNTIKAMERRGLITPSKGRDLLTIEWRLKKKQP
jgi:hypothetical protein